MKGLKTRARLIHRDGVHCSLCGGLMNFTHPRRQSYATIDHVKPKSKGGSSAIDNLRLAHRRCNEAKGNKMPGEQP